MRRLFVISILPFVLAGCPDKSKDAAKPGASAEPAKSGDPAANTAKDPGSQDKAGTDKEEDKGGW